MAFEIQGNLLRFVEFASNARSDNTIVRADNSINISATTKDKIAPLWRSRANQNANNVTRNLFKQAVAEMFGGEDKIPTDIRTAMKLDDKHFNASGKPLTARRILAVKNMLTTINDRISNGLDKVKENNSLKDLYAPGKDGAIDEQRRAKIDSLVSTAIHAAAGDQDVLDIVIDSIRHFVVNGEGALRNEDKVKGMVADLMANMTELRAAANGNREILKAGKKFLMAMEGKSMPKDFIAKLINIGMKVKIGSIKGLSASSSKDSLHKATMQYFENLDNAMNASGAKKLLEGSEPKRDAMNFIGAIMLARCSDSTARKIVLALDGDEARNLMTTYDIINNGGFPKNELSQGLAKNMMQLGGALASAMDGLKWIAQCRCGMDGQGINEIMPWGNGDQYDLGNTDFILESAKTFARKYAEEQRKTFINGIVQGNSISADKAREFHERRISAEAHNPQTTTTTQRNNITIGMINFNICDGCKKLANGEFKSSFFYQDLVRGDLNATLKIGGQTIKLYDDIAKERDDLTSLLTNNQTTKYSIQLPDDIKEKVNNLLFEKARNKLASFVTNGETTEYAKLDATAKTKVHIIMSMMSQESATIATFAHSCALDPNGRDQPKMQIDSTPLKEYAVSFNEIGQLVFECHANLDQIQMLEFLDERGDPEGEIRPGAGSSIQSNFSIFIGGNEFNRLADLNFKDFDSTQLRNAEDDPNVKHPYQKPELLGEDFGFAQRTVNCISSFKMILN